MNILLIDDDPGCLKSLASVLEMAKHVCQAFTVPAEALEAYRQKAFDVVITDLQMPVMNGIQVLQQIRSLNPDAKVIILTAYCDENAADAAMNNLAYSVLEKPLQLEEIITVLEEIEQDKAGPSAGRFGPEHE